MMDGAVGTFEVMVLIGCNDGHPGQLAKVLEALCVDNTRMAIRCRFPPVSSSPAAGLPRRHWKLRLGSRMGWGRRWQAAGWASSPAEGPALAGEGGQGVL